MSRSVRGMWVAGALAVGITGSAFAQLYTKPYKVYCGSTTCLVVPVSTSGKTPQQRAEVAMEVLNKNLGGKTGKFVTRPKGKNTDILLNGELMLTVTPEDAKAAKAKSVAALANTWKVSLSRAFEDTKAIK